MGAHSTMWMSLGQERGISYGTIQRLWRKCG